MTLTDGKREVKDLMETAEEREFWTVVREHERPPFYHESEGINNRLNKAARVVYEERITPNSDGSYTVEGSEKRMYRVADSCSCPNSQKGKSKWCYHMCAVALYVEWRKRLRPPVELGTLRPGTLPLPPTTVDERLAQSTTLDLSAAYVTPMPPTTPQEDLMTEDEAEYIPEPDNTPVAILEPPAAPPALRPLAPADDDLEQALATWTVQRGIVRKFLAQELKANVDYYTLKIGGKDSKPSLSKAGAEKVLGWLRWSASFAPDTGTWEMLGRPQDHLFYVCTLRLRSGEIIGEGRGARSLKKDNGDANKAVKMACKSSMVDAILRTGALSDVFTQDAEDMQDDREPAKAAVAKTTPARTTGQDLRQRIWGRMKELYPAVHSREDAETWIKARTGLELHPDNYETILTRLEA